MHVMINTAVSFATLTEGLSLPPRFDAETIPHFFMALLLHEAILPTVEHKHVCTVNRIPHQDD